MVKAAAKQEETEKLLRRRMQSESECRQALEHVKEAKRDAEAKLGAAEMELTQLKALHRDVAFRVRLDWALQSLAAKPTGYWQTASADVPPALVEFAARANVHHAVAEALQRGMPKTYTGDTDASPQAAMSFLKSIKSREELAEVVCSPTVLEGIVSNLWENMQGL